jgi:hypothetical protein
MAHQPGGLTELDKAAATAWDQALAKTVAAIKLPRQVQAVADARTPEVTGPDWPAYPVRVDACLGRDETHQLLDWRTDDGDEGRLRHQEEYLEWRVVRDGNGRPRRVEMTTEFAAYWKVLAANQPADAIALVGDFAGEPVPATGLYGDLDPFAAGVTSQQRGEAFSAIMLREGVSDLAGLSPYNSGTKAICCMIQSTNTLSALINLVGAASEPHVVIDSVSRETRLMSGSEAIHVIPAKAAQDCRNSDPVVVERVARLASEGRVIAFDDPIGVYIQGVEHRQLVLPDGAEVPREWFELSRGLGSDEAPDGRPRYQRLTLEVPPDQGFGLAELLHRTTGKPITHGAQIAELVKLGVYVCTSPQGALDVELKPEPLPTVTPCSDQPCPEIQKSWQEFQAAQEL